MQAYNGQPAESNPAAFELTPFHPRCRKNLWEWTARALAGIKPWRWSLRARLGRTWQRNQGGYVNGAHANERREREARCKDNVALLDRRRWYALCEQLPYRERLAARALTLAARRLISGGDWWKPRTLTNRSTGEVTQTVYLPEDTWSAETALDYCVSFLERLYAGARCMAERVTPRYRPGETMTVERRRPSALRDELDALLERVGRKFGAGGQPELPATT